MHRFPPDGLAGVERYAASLANGLIARGDEVAVVTRRVGGGDRIRLVQEERADGLVVHRLSGGVLGPDHFLAHAAELERAFTLALLEANPDVVHVAHLYGLSPRLVAIARRLRFPVALTLLDHYVACPLLHLQKLTGELCVGPDGGRECATTCFSHERRPERWSMRYAYYRGLLSVADRVLCPSRRVAQWFEAFAPEVAPIEVLPLGIPVERPVGGEGAPRAGALRLAFMGSVVPHKGVHVLVEASAAASVPVELDVFGRVYDPTYARDLERRADASPSVSLTLHGPYEDAEMLQVLAAVDAVVVPSQVPEVYPLVAYEALAHGVPLLAGSLGGLPEAVDVGANGLIFDASRPDELAAILRRLHEDRKLIARLRAGAASTQVVSSSDHVEAMRGVYTELAATGTYGNGALDQLDRLHERLVRAGFASAY